MKKQLLLFVSMLLPLVASADAVEIDGIYYNLVSEGQAEVTENPSEYYSGSITIPESVKNKGITYSVTSIGESAFLNCSGLTSIEIPNSVTSIGESAFRGCRGLTSVTIPNSVTSIGYRAFLNCSGLTSIEIPNSVTSIGGSAFRGCSGLTSVTIGNSVTSIGDDAFYGCYGLTSVTIGNSVTSIGGSAFMNCSGLTSIEIPNSVSSIGDDAFYGCYGLTSVTIGNSVTSIGGSAFMNCSGLTSIEIPNSVSSIGESAFKNCDGLTSVTIGNGIKSIGNNAFFRCTQLTDFYCFAESVPTTGSDVFFDSNLNHAKLHVPASSVNLYSNTEPWSGFSEIIEAQEKCATPTISFKNGKTYFECETPDVTYHYSITSPKIMTNLGDDVKVDLSYSLQVYASKDGYLDSDTATQDINIRGLKGDVNDDGDVTAQDASLILQKVAGKIDW